MNNFIFIWISENKLLALKIFLVLICTIIFTTTISYYYSYSQIENHLSNNLESYCQDPEKNGLMKINCAGFRMKKVYDFNNNLNLSNYILFNESL